MLMNLCPTDVQFTNGTLSICFYGKYPKKWMQTIRSEWECQEK